MIAFFNPHEAFGLPRGTVRASVWLIVTITICYMAVTGKEIQNALWSAWGAIVGYYFGQAKANQGNGQANDLRNPMADKPHG